MNRKQTLIDCTKEAMPSPIKLDVDQYIKAVDRFIESICGAYLFEEDPSIDQLSKLSNSEKQELWDSLTAKREGGTNWIMIEMHHHDLFRIVDDYSLLPRKAYYDIKSRLAGILKIYKKS